MRFFPFSSLKVRKTRKSVVYRIFTVKVLDHVIIGDNEYYSFADEGVLILNGIASTTHVKSA